MLNSLDAVFTPAFFRQLQQLKIHTRRAFLGSRQGSHLSARRGHGLEFSDFRVYTPGDDFRHIDWGVYGRTDRLYLRQFREEQDLNVSFLLDTSNSMRFPEGEGKFEMARNLALALAYVALTDGDSASISLLGQKTSPRYVGPRALSRAVSFVSDCAPGGSFSFENEVRAAIARLKIPGKCFFISDFLFDLEEQIRTLDLLRSRNFEIAAVQVLAPSEIKLDSSIAEALVVDAETGDELEIGLDPSSAKKYAYALATHIETLERYCFKSGIAHILVSSNERLSDVVLQRLPQLGLLK